MKIRKGKSKLKERVINIEVFSELPRVFTSGASRFHILPRSAEASEGK